MEQKEEIKKDVKKYAALDGIKSTPGGKILIESLQKDIISCVDEISTKYKSATHVELIALGAKLGERITILRTLNRASKNKKYAQEQLKFLTEESE